MNEKSQKIISLMLEEIKKNYLQAGFEDDEELQEAMGMAHIFLSGIISNFRKQDNSVLKMVTFAKSLTLYFDQLSIVEQSLNKKVQ
ncbi:hypothetical protein A9Q84_14540 [Halobacteriovorax marinus]|uniref:Uncharacterized protein n=1 Tax=Halobacteriovorax marinus TaxID=97084 RepID=A0A1Y5FBE0_9BACT|nr:hypothetical protein A9Q84_14540 [Halobacteriovorax marinus]